MKIIKNHLSRKVFIYDFIAFLCSEGILSHYNSGQFLIDNLNDQIDEFPTNFKSVIIGYEKALLQKFAKYHEKGWVNENSRFSYFTCYLYILSALRFLTFIVSVLNLQQPTEINNHTIDAFLRLKPYDKGNLRHFIMHINKNKITFMQLTLPNSNYKHELHVSISDDKQQQLIEACLYNEDILLRDRIIVLLMLLYGITPIEIRTLKRDNFIISKSKCTSKILYQNNQIKHEIPSKISSIVLKYLNSLHESAEFTFPGRLLNTSISLSSICRIMKYFNVSSTELHYTAINNSMLNGLYQPALLMKSFGINHMTAIRYFYLIKNLE
jgi:integrase